MTTPMFERAALIGLGLIGSSLSHAMRRGGLARTIVGNAQSEKTRDTALRLGLVAEVLPPDKLMARAWELAGDLTRKPTLLLRYTRLLFTEYLRRQMHDLLGYGLAMESLALFEKPDAPADGS